MDETFFIVVDYLLSWIMLVITIEESPRNNVHPGFKNYIKVCCDVGWLNCRRQSQGWGVTWLGCTNSHSKIKIRFNSKTASTKWYTLILTKEKKLYFQNLLNTFSAKLLILQLNDSSLIFQIFFSKGSSQFFRMYQITSSALSGCSCSPFHALYISHQTPVSSVQSLLPRHSLFSADYLFFL